MMKKNISGSEHLLKEVSFLSDSYTLKGMLHLPEAKSPPVVIGSHGLLSTGESPKQIELARKCNDLGIAYLRFDHRGCGKSGGFFKEVTSLESRCKDLICAYNMICERNDTGDRIGLFGSSLGGAASISVACELKIDAIVTFAAPLRSSSIFDAAKGSDDYKTCENLFNEEKLIFNISEKIEKIHNIIVFHGDADTVVPPSYAKMIYDKAKPPKKIVIQKGGDHNMSCKEHQESFVKQAASWFESSFFHK